MLEFRVLGPVEVRIDGRLVDAGPPRQRGVLAALAVDAGRPVQMDTLIDRVWGDSPPQRARHTLQVHLSRLRRVLEPPEGGAGRDADATGSGAGRDAAGGEARLVRRSGGYLLDVDPDRVDLLRFRGLLDQARDRQQPAMRQATLLRQALDLWQGVPLADLPGDWAARVREACHQQRRDALVDWAAAELRRGNPAAVLAPLAEAVAEYPLAEPVVAVLMRALSALGRDAEALDRYAAVRTRLADQLGADPGAELRAAYQAALRGGPATDRRGEPERQGQHGPQGRHQPVPAQLPLDIPGFLGRDEELDRLDAVLRAGAARPTAVTVCVLSGTAGVGKTTLAVHWAHRVRDRFPDGQLYVNLRGFDPTGTAVSSGDAVRAFLAALGVAPHRVPDDPSARTALYRSLLAGRRVLVVLDNARDAEQVRPLLPGSPDCLVLVTSRNQLTSLVAGEGAHPVRLDLLTDDDARGLLAARIGADRAAAEPAAVREIVAACARLPLALAILAARAATNPRLPLRVLAAELRDARGGLDAWHGGDRATDLRAVFSRSEHALSPAAARLFRLLGLYAGPDIGLPAAASLAGVSSARVRPLLAELTDAHLLDEHEPRRYTFHDLLRAFAAELGDTDVPGPDRESAVRRLLDHYLHTGHAAAMLLHPHADPLPLAAPEPGVTPEELGDREQALAWFAAEQRTLLAAVDRAGDAGLDTHVWQLVSTNATYVDRGGRWQEWLPVQEAALAAARRSADPAGEARTRRLLGLGQARLRRHDEARAQYQHALALFGDLGDHAGQAHTHLSISWSYGRQGRHADGLGHAEAALAAYRSAGNKAGQADALNAIGWRYAQLGDHEQSLTYCRQALDLHQATGHRQGEAATLDSLGYAHHHLGQYEQAADCYRRALELFRQAGDRMHEAELLVHLGDTHAAAGDVDAAARQWRAAVGILDDLDDPDADVVRAKLDGLGRH
ncbi:AfsR/SARP family transcriptional regulator [Micromonospora zhanjiangensis]|uniref:BTAD domain-containing putative transcriptional regulator n=1 Tax=Micromonospora zhanjiangensis TaxID=1522057 RepID=A0ABV8KR00_9ACTN